MTVSWSEEDDSEGEVENESFKLVMYLSGSCISDSESCDEELAYEELAASYKDLYTRSTYVCNLLEKHKKSISELQDERNEHLSKISGLNDDVILLEQRVFRKITSLVLMITRY